MKITGYRTLTTHFPWQRAIGDANGSLPDAVTAVPVVIVETDTGLEGIGIGSHADLDRLFPAVEGEDPRAASALYDRMLAQVFKSGHAGATYGGIAALDSAIWDLKAKAADEPLWRLLGGRDRFVPGYASGLDIALDDEDLHRFYADYADLGFVAGKLKGGLDLAADQRRLGIVADALSAHTDHPGLMIDANESWQLKQAVRHLSALEEHFDLTWVEEPLRRWDAAGHARLSRAVRAAVATGENLTGVDQFRGLIEAGAVDIVQAGAVWGVTHFLRLAYAADLHDLPISIVGHNANPAVAHAAAAVPNHLTTEVQALTWAPGVVVDQEIGDGGILLGQAPGAGISLTEGKIIGDPPGAGWADPSGPHRRPSRAGLRLLLDGIER
ncbi:mandelate racemase/muconate lactonizing enzyme family protein [Microlunatus soli]|uniref:L-alanine-DL-glutamate epimerase n=1 Tax=Microlunatus soli TaxID=630515 RepID=A0A1H1YD07_9ACTN|nr:mandelate racemase/muconate lactonizing enzyme family protein [Microlunatus soli]SDT18876.1 L-alanine-DL-glutamate epimerase [Microlunatus soli]